MDRRLPGPLRIAGPVTQHVSADGYRRRRFPLQSASDTCPFTLAAHLILRPSLAGPRRRATGGNRAVLAKLRVLVWKASAVLASLKLT